MLVYVSKLMSATVFFKIITSLTKIIEIFYGEYYEEVRPLLFQEVVNSGDCQKPFSEFEIAVAIIYLEQNASENKVF